MEYKTKAASAMAKGDRRGLQTGTMGGVVEKPNGVEHKNCEKARRIKSMGASTWRWGRS